MPHSGLLAPFLQHSLGSWTSSLYTPIDIVPPRTPHAPPPTTDLAQLARQLEDSWTAALASGEMQQGSHMLNNMNFIDALRAIGQREQPTESTSS